MCFQHYAENDLILDHIFCKCQIFFRKLMLATRPPDQSAGRALSFWVWLGGTAA
jgi:hypothetical protein